MHIPKPHIEKKGLDKVLDDLFEELNSVNADSEEYDRMTDQLVKLLEVKAKEKPWRPSADTTLIVLGNLLGVALIVAHERDSILTSKALSWIVKPKN